MLMSKPGSQLGLYTKPAVREMERSGTMFALPPTVVLIWAFGCTTVPVLQPAGLGVPALPTQGSERPGKLWASPAKNSLTLGMRKPWDQEPRSSKLSVACQRRAARPEALSAVCCRPAPGSPKLPPSKLNWDQRSARSRLTSFMNGASLTNGMLNSMYSALVPSRPLEGSAVLPLVLPSTVSASGWNNASCSRDSTPRARPKGPAGMSNRSPLMLAV